jgi:hypothetical protein
MIIDGIRSVSDCWTGGGAIASGFAKDMREIGGSSVFLSIIVPRLNGCDAPTGERVSAAICFWGAKADCFGGEDEDEVKDEGIKEEEMLTEEAALPGLGPPAMASLFLTIWLRKVLNGLTKTKRVQQRRLM